MKNVCKKREEECTLILSQKAAFDRVQRKKCESFWERKMLVRACCWDWKKCTQRQSVRSDLYTRVCERNKTDSKKKSKMKKIMSTMKRFVEIKGGS